MRRPGPREGRRTRGIGERFAGPWPYGAARGGDGCGEEGAIEPACRGAERGHPPASSVKPERRARASHTWPGALFFAAQKPDACAPGTDCQRECPATPPTSSACSRPSPAHRFVRDRRIRGDLRVHRGVCRAAVDPRRRAVAAVPARGDRPAVRRDGGGAAARRSLTGCACWFRRHACTCADVDRDQGVLPDPAGARRRARADS